MRVKIKKNDIILIISISALAALLALCGLLFIPRTASNARKYVRVSVDGREIVTLPLDRDTVYKVELSDGRYNIVSVSDGAAYVSEASCPDRLCVKTGRISKPGESAVCLPNRLVAVITDSDEQSDT